MAYSNFVAQTYLPIIGTNGLATQLYVTSRGYVTQSVTNGLATEVWVGQQGYRTTDSNAVIAVGSGCSIVAVTNGTVVTYTLTVPPSGTDSNTVNALIAAGTSLNASNWLGWAGASNWLHTAFLSINGTATVAQTALAGWPTQWAWSAITNAPAFLTSIPPLWQVVNAGDTLTNRNIVFLQTQAYEPSSILFVGYDEMTQEWHTNKLTNIQGNLSLSTWSNDVSFGFLASGLWVSGAPIHGDGSGLTNLPPDASKVTTGATAVVLVPGNNITINGGSSPVTLKVGETGTIASTASGGGITAFYWPQSRGVIPSGSGATRYGTDYQFTSFPTLTNSVLTFWNLPIVNTVSNLAVWSSAASGVATTTYLFAFAAYDGTTNAPSYTITNYVTAVSGASKVTSNCTTAVTPGTWTMKMFPVSGSTNSLLSTVEGNIQ
jgi:hypothetical protein